MKVLIILETFHWRKIEAKGQVPTKRTSHSAVVYQDKMYVFGGFSGEKYLNDIAEYDFGEENELIPVYLLLQKPKLGQT